LRPNRFKILLACEEIFINICNYAYSNIPGDIFVEIAIINDEVFEIKFVDNGVRFDPTSFEVDEKEVYKNFKSRRVGGLGIFIAKQIMDKIEYEYVENKNSLKMTKILVSPLQI